MQFRAICFAAVLLAAGQARLTAQSRNTLLLGAGLSAPTGIFNTYAGNGTDITVGAEHAFGRRTSLRIDFSYATNGDTSGVGFHETTHMISGMVNFVYHFVDAHPHIYVLAGAGILARRFSSMDPNDTPINDSRLGFQVGEGVTFRVKSVALFLEGRFVSATGQQPLQFFPVVVGVRF
jgi:opacity protein-like surface antigen